MSIRDKIFFAAKNTGVRKPLWGKLFMAQFVFSVVIF
jgi:hypothetical protein